MSILNPPKSLPLRQFGGPPPFANNGGFSVLSGGSDGDGGGGEPPAAVSSTRWRLNITQVAIPGNNPSAGEIEMALTSGGADQCTGGTATASAQLTGYEASKAFDNDNAQWWVSPSGVTQWIEYEFTSTVAIIELRYRSRTDFPWGEHEAVETGTLQYYDGATWQDHIYIAGEQNTAIGGQLIFRNLGTIGAGQYRFWRIRETDTYGSGTLIVNEVEMRESVSGSDVTDATQTTVGRAIGSRSNNSGTVPVSAFTASADNYQHNNFSTAGTAFLGYRFDTPRKIVEITVKAGSGGSEARCLKSFVVEASNTGASGSWTTLHTVTNEAAWSAGETRTYSW